MSQPSAGPGPVEVLAVSRSAADLAAYLRSRGERLTAPRLAVLGTLLQEAEHHPTAEVLRDAVRRAHPELAESSVYRALDWLETQGIAVHVHLGHGPATWHLADDDRIHAVCDRCGVVEHLPVEWLHPLREHVRRVQGFDIALNHYALSGRCAACAGRAGSGDDRGSVAPMSIQGEYVPSPAAWVRDQVEAYERSGGTDANTLRDTGIPIIVVTMRGMRSGKVRKIALMRVEHDGSYALVASMGGAPTNPKWYDNLVANPDEVTVQDGPAPFDVTVREVHGDERALWWDRSVAVFPNYADYQARTERTIPVLVATRR